MGTSRKNRIQELCRKYLRKLTALANKHRLGDWLQRLIADNESGKCSATEDELLALARLCDDERIARKDIPHLIGKSYRHCYENDYFSHIKMLENNGRYSKVDAMLYEENKQDNLHNEDKDKRIDC